MPSTLPACAAKQVISSPWGAPLLGSPKPVADSHAKDAPRQISSNLRTSPDLRAAPLTSREREIALLVARGLSNKEIAVELQSSPGTIKVHLHNIYQKL